MTANRLTQAEFDQLRRLSEQGTPGPWRSLIEGRDHWSGDSFIMIGEGDARDVDMYVFRDRTPASVADLDLIAAARTYLPLLLDEITALRSGRSDDG